MKLLNTLIAALAFALPLSTSIAQHIRVDVPLGIQMGDKLEDVVKKNKLKWLGVANVYDVRGRKDILTIFRAISLMSHESTGVCVVLLISEGYSREQEDLFWKDAQELSDRLSAKYGKGVILPPENTGGEINVGWAVKNIRSPKGNPESTGDVDSMFLTAVPWPEGRSARIHLKYTFSNYDECDKAINDDKFKGL